MTEVELEPIRAALQVQVSRDFAPHYCDAKIGNDGDWKIFICDNSDQAGALGYHSYDPTGTPVGFAFIADDIKYGNKPSITISHELLEMLADPGINLLANGPGDIEYCYEVCDACEADQFGYQIDGVWVSDFVLPAWFESFQKHGPFDHMNHITKPFQLLTGGYIGYKKNGKFHQLMGAKAAKGSRRDRRTNSPGVQ